MYRSTLPLATALALAAAPVLAQSDGNPATSNILTGGLVVPYDGFLMLDNTPMNGTQNLRFELWDHPTQAAANRRVWSEDQTVTFFNGRFSVGLGAGTQISTRTIQDVVQDGEKLYLAIQVRDGTGALVQLSGRQAIEPAPYAAWSASAADLNVGGNLSVGGQLTASTANVTGQLTASTANVSGNLQAGTVSASGSLSAAVDAVVLRDVLAGRNVAVNGQVQAGSVSTSGQVQAASANVGTITGGTIQASTNLSTGGNDFSIGTTANGFGNGGRALAKRANDTLIVNLGNEFSGGTTVQSNLSYTGLFRGWSVTGAFSQNNNGNRNLGVTTSQGICFLTRFSTDHNHLDPNAMACHVNVQGVTWHLSNNEVGGNRGNVDCEARCLIF